METLMAHLLDLLFILRERNISIMLGGGLGLFLKRQHFIESGERMLFQALPEPRATNDMDMFLRVEFLANLERTRDLKHAIVGLGYEVVEEAKFLQWKRSVQIGGVSQHVKIDVLVGPLGDFRNQLKVNRPRVRPRGNIEFHAHLVEEAICIEDQPILIPVQGNRTNGEPHSDLVEVPEAFPYLMMKLHAFADRINDSNKDLGRHHALDLYAIVGMMTQREYERAMQLGRDHASHPQVQIARDIVETSFEDGTDLGILRIREHPLFRNAFQLDDFRQMLRDIFHA